MDSPSPTVDASVYFSPDGSIEPTRTEDIKPSVSVSSLAEKFEKGGESTKYKNSEVNGVRVSELNGTASDHSTGDSRGNSPSKRVSESAGAGKTVCVETSPKSEGDSVFVAENLKNKSDSSGLESSESSGAVKGEKKQDNFAYSEACKAVEERVAYFVERISKSSQNSAKTDNSNISPSKEAEKLSPKSGVPSQLSLKDLESSFVAALNLANASEEEKAVDTLSVPCIKITEASDREDTSSEDSQETKESEVSKAENKESVEEMDISNANDEKPEPIPSTSTAFQDEKNDESEISAEERRAFFFISSAELPAGLVNDILEESPDELRQRSTNQQEHRENFVTPRPEMRNPSCLCSKTVHGAIFVFSFIVAIFGFILYSLANQGKIPHFCQHLGLITAVIAGTIGAFCCFCFTFLEAFPRFVIPGYERLLAAERAPVLNDMNKNVQAQSLDDESWSSEKERAFRIQNGMSSTRTSAASLERSASNPRELIEKTEKLKKDVVELLDTFTEMIRMENTDQASEKESGIADERV